MTRYFFIIILLVVVSQGASAAEKQKEVYEFKPLYYYKHIEGVRHSTGGFRFENKIDGVDVIFTDYVSCPNIDSKKSELIDEFYRKNWNKIVQAIKDNHCDLKETIGLVATHNGGVRIVGVKDGKRQPIAVIGDGGLKSLYDLCHNEELQKEGHISDSQIQTLPKDPQK